MNTVIDQMNRELKKLERLPQLACEKSANHVVGNTRKFSGQAQVNTRMARNRQDTAVRLAPSYFRNAIPDSQQNRAQHFAQESRRIKIGDRVHISNNLDYIDSVEYQLGDAMFEKAIARWRTHNREAIQELR